MPRLSVRHQVLSSIDALILCHAALIGHHSSTTSSILLPNLIITLTLVSFIQLDDKPDGNVENNDIFMISAYTIMMLSIMAQLACMEREKRLREVDKSLLAGLLSIRHQSHKRRYILPRDSRPRRHMKELTFMGWFQETDRTWLTVVSSLSNLYLGLCWM